jgi:4-amino-4-deoxy-L-arabinose transferase-like glycosyltransferase
MKKIVCCFNKAVDRESLMSEQHWSSKGIISWYGPVCIAVAALAGFIWTWSAWPDPIIDFGKELYVPWRLLEGDVLYADMAYYNGPLSPYLNSILFRLFGVSLRTLIICNAVIAAALLVLLYRLMLQIGDRLSSATACIIFLVVFAFGNLSGDANYNYICPYSHEMTHGIVLSMASVLCVSLYQRRGSNIYIAGAGLALGLIFLTKVELFFAAMPAVCIGLAPTVLLKPLSQSARLRLLGIFVSSTLVPVIIAFRLLSLVMPMGKALLATTGSFPWALGGEVPSMSFFKFITGLDEPLLNIKKILFWGMLYSAVFLPAGLLSFLMRSKGLHRPVVALVFFITTAVLLTFESFQNPRLWLDIARPLPLLMLVLVVWFFVGLLMKQYDERGRERIILQLCMAVLSLLLLAKIVLFSRIYHYGFVLAMPATLLTVVMLTCWVPEWISRRGGYGGAFKAAALGILFATALFLTFSRGLYLSNKTCKVSKGADAFLTDRRGEVINTLLEKIDNLVKPDETLAVFPEGVMINYLARRINPTPYTSFMPVELLMFGEEKMLTALKENPPDWVVLVHRDYSMPGLRFFGRDFGGSLSDWIVNHYDVQERIGEMPFTGRHFGALLAKRKTDGSGF